MIHQYYAPRHRANDPRQRGTAPAGTIFRLPAHPGAPLIVLGWLPRDYQKYKDGAFRTVKIRGGHLALVQCLHDRRRVFRLSDHHIQSAIDNEK